MSGNFWQSSHYKQWLLTEEFLMRERSGDLQVLSEVDYQKIMIFFANVIQAIGENLKMRQQVIATATVYFKRFYAKHPLKSCDPILLAPTCLFLATKVDEFGLISHQRVLQSCVQVFKSKFSYAFPNEFPYRSSNISECEFYLLELMDCCLIVYHPYRPLLQFASDLGLSDALLPLAWRIVNDSYRTDVVLMYAPFQIALACLHMACVIQNQENAAKQWFAELNVDFEKIIEITKAILNLYELWKAFEEKREIPELLLKMPKSILKGDNQTGRASAPITAN